MSAQQTVARYYDAWQSKRGDMSDVPLADDFRFTGPVASSRAPRATGRWRAKPSQAVTSFDVRRQFVDGDAVGRLARAGRASRERARCGLNVPDRDESLA